MSRALYHRQDARPLLMDPVRAAAPYVGVPWRPRGDSPEGWDCRGCVRFLRREIFGLESPGMARDSYSFSDLRSPERREELIRERIALWRPVSARPGAVIVFRAFGCDSHVGLVLSASDFIHSLGGQETTILRLDDVTWFPRIRGFYDTENDDRAPRPGALLPDR